MTTVLCPGSFDPPTLGHVDVISAAAALFDEVVVAVLVNPAKAGLFTVAERTSMLREVTADLPGVVVDSFEGLLVDYCASRGIRGIVKGIRTVGDVEYELAMANMNAHLSGVRTVLVPSAAEYSFISSSLVKQVAGYGGDVSRLVPSSVAARLAQKIGSAEH